MAAVANHALWVEALRRHDRIRRRHHPEFRKSVKRGDSTLTKKATKEPKRKVSPPQLPLQLCFAGMNQQPFSSHGDTLVDFREDRCKECGGNLTVFCYTCCQCGCRPSKPEEITSHQQAIICCPVIPPVNSNVLLKSHYLCKMGCVCKNCPTERIPSCMCGCNSKRDSSARQEQHQRAVRSCKCKCRCK
ncbi:uncharacterized protein LOC118183577 [Stegodyphus dumicola]|uniref:uncharacterized protein LOC118183577 n=1 Tax=Stegodyphus dumicola TaxID=202533 RepID=UPI0015ADD2BA|nr:uncharacterized protein LOC118183577 [Stegodyphus dumicola]